MPLVLSHRDCVGRKLFVLPYYGYGWHREDAPAPAQTRFDLLGPEPFHLKVDECINCESLTVGISGFIHEPAHKLDGFWCCCLLRHTDDADFTERTSHYMVWIAQKKLSVDPAPYHEKALYEWVTPEKSGFCLCGYGTVAESADWIKEIYERTISTRRRVENEMQSG
jgi:hypothetical protein